MGNMIERLTPEQARPLRRQMLSDTVYVVFHDVLKSWNKEGKTRLTPQEICLSARNLCDVVCQLPDSEEGVCDELDDLEEEASGIAGASADAMLVEMMAAAMLTAMSADRYKPVILCIMRRWCGHELFDALLEEGCRKEEARYAEGKRADLLHYELMEIGREGGENAGSMRRFIEQCLTPAYGKSLDTIKEMLLSLNRCNIEFFHHQLDAPLLELYKRLDGDLQGVSAGGDNRGIMTGGDLNAGFTLTDPQAALMAKAIAAGGIRPGLGNS